jgi:hypothetical protein
MHFVDVPFWQTLIMSWISIAFYEITGWILRGVFKK